MIVASYMTPEINILMLEGKADESGLGFITRTLIENHLSWTWLRKVAGITPQCFPTRKDMSGLQLVLGCAISEDSLVSARKMADGKMHWGLYANIFAYQSQLQLKSPKVCGMCLLQCGYTKRLWDLDMVTVCPFHKLRLADRCSACKLQITWCRASLAYCRCGYPFLSEETSELNDAELEWAQWAAEKLSGKIAERNTIFPSSISELPMGVVIQLIRILGVAAIGRKLSLSKIASTRYGAKNNQSVITQGLASLRKILSGELPQGFEEFSYEIDLQLCSLMNFVEQPAHFSALYCLYYQCFQTVPPIKRGRFSAQLTLEI